MTKYRLIKMYCWGFTVDTRQNVDSLSCIVGGLLWIQDKM